MIVKPTVNEDGSTMSVVPFLCKILEKAKCQSNKEYNYRFELGSYWIYQLITEQDSASHDYATIHTLFGVPVSRNYTSEFEIKLWKDVTEE